jgi:hypothetical protein
MEIALQAYFKCEAMTGGSSTHTSSESSQRTKFVVFCRNQSPNAVKKVFGVL